MQDQFLQWLNLVEVQHNFTIYASFCGIKKYSLKTMTKAPDCKQNHDYWLQKEPNPVGQLETALEIRKKTGNSCTT